MNREGLLTKVNEKISFIIEGKENLLPGFYTEAGLDQGKRLRAGTFLYFSGDESEKSLKLAAAIELLHAATLIHDDILDKAELRRGKPALHTRHGIPASLLYGDYLFTSAFSLIAELEDTRVYKLTTEALKEVLQGEMLENSRRGDLSLTEPEYLAIIEKKTGKLFGLASRLGAMVRGLDERDVERSFQFGIKTGIAYQLLDDYADYFDHSENKEKFRDLKEKVITLPLIYLLRQSTLEEKRNLSSVLSDRRPDEEKIKEIVSLMENYQIPAEISKEIKDFLEEAKRLLPESVTDEQREYFDLSLWIEDKLKTCPKII